MRDIVNGFPLAHIFSGRENALCKVALYLFPSHIDLDFAFTVHGESEPGGGDEFILKNLFMAAG